MEKIYILRIVIDAEGYHAVLKIVRVHQFSDFGGGAVDPLVAVPVFHVVAIAMKDLKLLFEGID